jgi:glycosyltransferase involved in cell wall biosynthesis
MKKPKISLVMTVYNQETFLKKAIKSILEQSFSDFEFLILDDASTDKSLEVIRGFRDKRIKVFQNKKRKGLSKNLNFLIKQSKGKYIARMDGDDVSEKGRLANQVAFLDKHPEVALVCSWAKIINKEDELVGEFSYPTDYGEIRKNILNYNPFVHPSAMFRKNIFEKIGGYDKNLFYSQDYDLFLKFVSQYPCVNLPKFLLKFRWQPDFKKQKKQQLTALKIRLKAIKDYGYKRWEMVKLIKPLFFYLIPDFIKKIYWRNKLK